MLSSDTLRRSLRRTITHPRFDALLRADGGRYEALAAFATGAGLAAFLDQTPLYSPERDAVLADLLRWSRAFGDGPPRDAAMYAVMPAVVWVARQVAPSTTEPFETVLGDVLRLATLEVARYDPDPRSPHVMACLRMNIRRDATRALVREQRRTARTRAAARDLRALAPDPRSRDRPATVFDLAPAPDGSSRELDEGDVDYGRDVFQRLVQDGALDERDYHLLVARLLLGQTATALSLEHGVDRRTIQRRVERVLERIGDRLRDELLRPDARF